VNEEIFVILDCWLPCSGKCSLCDWISCLFQLEEDLLILCCKNLSDRN